MRRAEIVTALLMAAFSIYLMWKSAELDIGFIEDEGPGGGTWHRDPSRWWQPFDRNIDLHISHLRRKIEADPNKPRRIRTVRGEGYIFSDSTKRRT